MYAHLKPAFKKLGWDVTFPQSLHSWYDRVNIQPKIDDFNKIFAENEFDFVFALQLNIPLEIYSKIYDCIPKKLLKVWWTIEDPNCFDCFIEQAKLYDFVFTSASEKIPEYHKAGIKNVDYLQLAANPELHKPGISTDLELDLKYAVEDEVKKIKVKDIKFEGVFVGNKYNHYKERMKGEEIILKPLLEHKKNFTIIGAAAWKESEYKDHWFGASHWGDLFKIYQRADIVLGMNSQRESPTMTSMRVYEVLACKKLLLTDWSLATERFFENGKHLVISKSPEETIKLYNYYMAHPEEREKIATAGYKFVMENHTYVNRLQRVLRVLKQNKLLEV